VANVLRASLGIVALLVGVLWLAGALRPRHPPALAAALGRAGTAGTLAAAVAGGIATVAVQSSSLVIVGLLAVADAEAVPLASVWAAVLGANVGTALVPQLLVWQPPLGLAVAAAAPAVALWCWPRTARVGRALTGAVAVYTGLELVAGAARQAAPAGLLLALTAAGPLTAYAAGVLSTAVLLSSTLTVGMAQRFVAAGLLPLPAGLAFVLGANVGTTADVLLAAGGCRRRGRATAAFHALFNLVASAVCLPLVARAARLLTDFGVPGATAVAHFHAVFNIGAALVALPFVAPLAQRAAAGIGP
jgi:phosphate:Na+ symporter